MEFQSSQKDNSNFTNLSNTAETEKETEKDRQTNNRITSKLFQINNTLGKLIYFTAYEEQKKNGTFLENLSLRFHVVSSDWLFSQLLLKAEARLQVNSPGRWHTLCYLISLGGWGITMHTKELYKKIYVH